MIIFDKLLALLGLMRIGRAEKICVALHQASVRQTVVWVKNDFGIDKKPEYLREAREWAQQAFRAVLPIYGDDVIFKYPDEKLDAVLDELAHYG